MIAQAKIPHYLLFTDATDGRDRFDDTACSQWCFRLESLTSLDEVVEVTDVEAESSLDRMELLAVVRGLEALDQPSRVTLVTPSRYVARGLRFGMDAWRESNWHWEDYGVMSPVKNHDLWRRVDRAMEIHQVEHRRWRLGESSESPESSEGADASSEGSSGHTGFAAGDVMSDMAAVAV